MNEARSHIMLKNSKFTFTQLKPKEQQTKVDHGRMRTQSSLQDMPLGTNYVVRLRQGEGQAWELA